MAELKIDGRMKVETLKKNFKEVFGGVLRVYKDDKNHRADDCQLLCDLRADDAPATGEFLCRSSITVAGFRKRMQEVFGITVKVATVDDWVLVLDDITLANVGKIPKQATIEIMQQFRSNYGKKAEGKKKNDMTEIENRHNHLRIKLEWVERADDGEYLDSDAIAGMYADHSVCWSDEPENPVYISIEYASGETECRVVHPDGALEMDTWFDDDDMEEKHNNLQVKFEWVDQVDTGEYLDSDAAAGMYNDHSVCWSDEPENPVYISIEYANGETDCRIVHPDGTLEMDTWFDD
jgi:hypothetical protein